MNQALIVLVLIQLPVLMLAVIVHECAHGWMAERCGDDTARVMGRITLNPLPHIDIVGTLVLPIVFIALSSPYMFGYAKPVPINPYRFYHPRRDTVLVSLAGPVSNILLAVISSILLRFFLVVPGFSMEIRIIIIKLFSYGVFINLLLAFLNLIPIPPLDGSGIVANILPVDLARQYEKIRPYGFFIIIVLLMTGVIGAIIMPFLHISTRILLGGISL